MIFKNTITDNSDFGKLILRASTGGLMLFHGIYLYTKGFVLFGLNSFGGLNSELDLLYLFSSLALVFLGGGKYAIAFNFKKQKMLQNKQGQRIKNIGLPTT